MITELKLTELTRLDDVLGHYDVYKDCMYMPTSDKFERRMRAYLADETARIYACLSGDIVVGMAVCVCAKNSVLEIVGIAVERAHRCKGIGLYMISNIKNKYIDCTLYAETDDDAVGFYRKCGFTVSEYTQEYDGQSVRRYKCTL